MAVDRRMPQLSRPPPGFGTHSHAAPGTDPSKDVRGCAGLAVDLAMGEDFAAGFPRDFQHRHVWRVRPDERS